MNRRSAVVVREYFSEIKVGLFLEYPKIKNSE